MHKKYFLYACGWLGVVSGIAGILTGNPLFMAGGVILLFVYSFDARKRGEE